MARGDPQPVVKKSTFQLELLKLRERSIFGTEFMNVYGSMDWTEDGPNIAAAHRFRTTLISRIATARLPYGSGTEKRALKSIVELFANAREVTAENVGCGTFEILVWHTLNAVVRPFTAKWHPLSEAGALEALDSSDEFRAELYRVQGELRQLERALALLEGGMASYDPSTPISSSTSEKPPSKAVWRPAGNIPSFSDIERAAVISRRSNTNYKVANEDDWAAGLALSGGGIRSATFSLGVLAALARRNLLPAFDYLSTVSGGGYTGCFLTSLLGQKDLPEGMGLASNQEPFKRTEKESTILMGVRQRASFLSAGFLERLLLVMRSTYGVFVNVLVLFGAIAFFAAIELSIRCGVARWDIPSWLAWLFPLVALFLLAFVARKEKLQLKELNRVHLALGALFCFPLAGMAFQLFHTAIDELTSASIVPGLSGLSATLLVGATLMAILGAVFAVYAKARPAAAIAITPIFLLFVEHSFFAVFRVVPLYQTMVLLAAIAVFGGLLWLWVDVNETSLYRYYRSKLATAFIHTEGDNPPPKISELACGATFYPIINCALNAPGSQDPKMRGRLADVFSFTPHMTGSNLLEYSNTGRWETWNPKLDLASAMALSGAAVSPQMGLRTTRRGSFWLTLFNARLNAWLKNPLKAAEGEKPPSGFTWSRQGPSLRYLVHEFMANANEDLPYANISDGGHIENLGVYELLRRRCRYIVAIDGESDPRMTFHALTNLQRLAYIDMGILIDAELDELRLQESGFSRSHFRFCRVRYPTGDNKDPWEIGYLLYVKLSLTGNEGEFLRRYRLDEPMFPHHSTADQFFSETQFEAYRSLGEHVGEKLFMEAIIEKLAEKPEIGVKEWMEKYAKNFLNEAESADSRPPLSSTNGTAQEDVRDDH
ncbi:patatin-like phospholipase family protein [Rhizobium sp. 3T7]|uniref:patatin-like phospholipase family protein n=1 Tax=Rhizobium sp. 3T7 TaxID=2874922 RepID=UPI001CCDA523|nr:patatin-like phospholipase family protein [Rhizobium sp. 3T7]MBZ9790503.1 patatin-like phospholipase family protein [Rhizobium sp. 3T7]